MSLGAEGVTHRRAGAPTAAGSGHGREERGRFVTLLSSLDRRGEIVEDIAALLLEGHDHGHHALDEASTAVGVHPLRGPAPNDAVPHGLFGEIMPRTKLCRVATAQHLRCSLSELENVA